MNNLYLIAFNLTRRCNLACAHCYLDASQRQQAGEGELGREAVVQLIDQIADHSPAALLVLTGGEPLLRDDLESIAHHASGRGLGVVVGSNGTLLDRRRAASLQEAGVMGVGISLDSLDPQCHDRFRGRRGSWAAAMEGIEACRSVGLPFQIHLSIGRHNLDQLDGMARFARDVGAVVLNLFFLVCVGRGERVTELSTSETERLLVRMVELEGAFPGVMIRARCAPQFKRVAHQLAPERALTRAAGYEGGGCLAGRHYARITPQGELTACPYIEESEGSLLTTPFATLWEESPRLQLLRRLWHGDADYDGRCGVCEYRLLCGGCRARPVALGGSLIDSDPQCGWIPADGELVRPVEAAGGALAWSGEARARLERIPPFLRQRVEQRAEAYAGQRGDVRVEVLHLEQLLELRFGAALPWRRPGSRSDWSGNQ